MEPVIAETVQKKLEQFVNQNVYVHLETTNGAYASHNDESFFSLAPIFVMHLYNSKEVKLQEMGPLELD